MSLVVFTGGARSGKSAAAQELAATLELDGRTVCVAVFGREDDDPEFAQRIARHRAARPTAWSVVEATHSNLWLSSVSAHDVLVVDCLGTLLGLVMEEAYVAATHGSLTDADAMSLPLGMDTDVDTRFSVIVSALAQRDGDTIVVTNEVGDATVPGYATERLFRDTLGRANRSLVNVADAAYLCVAGRLVALHDLPSTATWPSD